MSQDWTEVRPVDVRPHCPDRHSVAPVAPEGRRGPHLEVRLGPREAHFRGITLELTAKEFDMLAYLAARHGTVVSKDELHAAVWKAPAGTEGRTVDVHLSNLRRKMGETATSEDRYLHTVIGAGVRLQAPDA